MGAEPVPGGVDFRVWAPAASEARLALEAGDEVVLPAEGGGWFGAVVSGLEAGALYRYRLDGAGPFPDPASRFQPAGPHGPSQVVDPSFAWTDAAWAGVRPRGQALYELHVGTFTSRGDFEGVADRLEDLRELGVTVIELMPIAEFPGRFGWGYDGVDLFAPSRLYGGPWGLRRLVDRAHALGLGVILDVVQNHLGPDGDYLSRFDPDFFTDRHETEWGRAINFDGPGSGPGRGGARGFFCANTRMWIEEFHLDGLRFDATQCVFDASDPHILAELTAEARAAAGSRSVLLIAENEPQNTRLARPPEEGGHGFDALWTDDFHHTARVAATGRREAYYSAHLGGAQEFVSLAKYHTLYQGQRYSWQRQARGMPATGLPSHAFVHYLQNHDQVANSGRGLRLHQLTSPGRWRALTALWLLMPTMPLFFQGQEFAASAPFLFFADHGRDGLGPLITAGRRQFLGQFPSLSAMSDQLADPCDPASFARCVLDHGERARHTGAWTLHRDLLGLRRTDRVLLAAQDGGDIDGAVLGPEAFVLRWFGEAGSDRLLLVNLGADLDLIPTPEPLLAPPPGRRWRVAFSSEDPVYDGCGTAAPERVEGWHLMGHAAVFLAAG